MCKAGVVPPVEISPGILGPTAHNNSSAEATYVKDSIHTVVNVTITSGVALLLGFLILLVAVLCLHRLLKAHHSLHTQRINTLSALTGYGHKDIITEEADTQV